MFVFRVENLPPPPHMNPELARSNADYCNALKKQIQRQCIAAFNSRPASIMKLHEPVPQQSLWPPSTRNSGSLRGRLHNVHAPSSVPVASRGAGGLPSTHDTPAGQSHVQHGNGVSGRGVEYRTPRAHDQTPQSAPTMPQSSLGQPLFANDYEPTETSQSTRSALSTSSRQSSDTRTPSQLQGSSARDALRLATQGSAEFAPFSSAGSDPSGGPNRPFAYRTDATSMNDLSLSLGGFGLNARKPERALRGGSFVCVCSPILKESSKWFTFLYHGS